MQKKSEFIIQTSRNSHCNDKERHKIVGIWFNEYTFGLLIFIKENKAFKLLRRLTKSTQESFKQNHSITMQNYQVL